MLTHGQFHSIVLLGQLLTSYHLLRALALDSGSDFALEGKSFSIRTVVTTYLSLEDGAKLDTKHLLEEYSFEQRRAKIQYLIDEDRNSAERYHYDAKIGLGLFYSDSADCHGAGTIKDYHEYLFKDCPKMRDLLEMKVEGQDLSHIIGPARLLFLIADKLDQLKPVEKSDSVRKLSSKRNRPLLEYKLTLDLNGDPEGTLLSVYYDETTLKGTRLEASIPLLVSVKLSNPTKVFAIGFHGKKFIDERQLRPELMDLSGHSYEKVTDNFAFPLARGCSEYFGSDNLQDPFGIFDLDTIKFSLNVDSHPIQSEFRKFYIAYDGMIKSLRIDSRLKSTEPNEQFHDTIKLFDLKSNRKYTIFNKALSKIENDKIGHDNELDAKGQCIVTYIFPPEMSYAQRWSRFKLSKFLTGAEKFTFMGRARVMGIAALVYEAKTSSFPQWYSQAALFKDMKGNYGSREGGNTMLQQRTKGKKQSLTVLIYVSESSVEEFSLKLLLLEVYSLNFAGDSQPSKILTSHFQNHLWELNGSQNGDRPDDLFSYQTLCPTNDVKYAELELLLEHENIDQVDKNFDWIRNWLPRNVALGASIADALDVQNIMIFDLESKLVSGPKISILTSFRVLEHPQTLYNIIFVGNAVLSDSIDHDRVLKISSSPLSDCLWMAAKSSYIYYADIGQICLVDLDLPADSDLSKSNLFKLDPGSAGELYKVEVQFGEESSLSKTWLRDGKFQHLENRLMIMQNYKSNNPRMSIDPNGLRLRIKRAKLKNLNYLGDFAASGTKTQPIPFVLSGFRLQEQDTQSLVVEKKASDWFLSQEECHAACLEDLNCKTFSYCSERSKNQCILSEISLEVVGIQAQLSSATVKKLTFGTSVTVDAGQFKVSLVRDFRCELRNKIYTDLFSLSGSVNSHLSWMDVSPVASLEKCAESCFLMSLEALSTAANIGRQITEMTQSEDLISNDDEHIKFSELHKARKTTLNRFCGYFFYLDSTLDENQRRYIQQRDPSINIESSKYCALPTSSAQGETEVKVIFPVDRYKFDFNKLYEKKAGFRMAESPKSPEEIKAYMAVSRASKNPDHGQQLAVLNRALSSGKNFQLRLNSEINCAEYCFLQTSGLWPACRSYDVVKTIQWNGSMSTSCVLNTMSIYQPGAEDLKQSSKLNSVLMYHYEPRFGVVRQEASDTYQLSLTTEGLSPKLDDTEPQIEGLLVAMLLALLGITSGLILGATISRKLSRGPDLDEAIFTPPSLELREI